MRFYAVVEVIANPFQRQSAYPSAVRACRFTGVWEVLQQLASTADIFVERLRRLVAILQPPSPCCTNLQLGTR